MKKEAQNAKTGKDNVLDGYVTVSKLYKADVVTRITRRLSGRCKLIDTTVESFLKEELDYFNTNLPFSDGLDVEIFRPKHMMPIKKQRFF